MYYIILEIRKGTANVKVYSPEPESTLLYNRVYLLMHTQISRIILTIYNSIRKDLCDKGHVANCEAFNDFSKRYHIPIHDDVYYYIIDRLQTVKSKLKNSTKNTIFTDVFDILNVKEMDDYITVRLL